MNRFLAATILTSMAACSISLFVSEAASAKSITGTRSISSYPCIVNGPSNADTQLILKAAKIAFNSKSVRLAEAGEEIHSKMKEMVVFPNGVDLDADPDKFEVKKNDSIEYGDTSKSKLMAIQKNKFCETRFFVRQKYFNWRGDWHIVVLVRAADTAEEIFNKFDGLEFEPNQKLDAGYELVLRDIWENPWLFESKTPNKLLLVDTQNPGEILSDWDVYEPLRDGKCKLVCKIRFRPPAEKDFAFVPKGALHDIAILLDKIIGVEPPDSGTMHPFSTLRNNVQHMWADAIFRPWVEYKPSNSKVEVDNHLKKWQKGSPVYRAQYEQLHKLYPQALAALTQYYESKFKMSHKVALKTATRNMENAYRANFTI